MRIGSFGSFVSPGAPNIFVSMPTETFGALKLQIHIPLNAFVWLYLKTNWEFWCLGRDRSCVLGLQILGHSADMVIGLLL